MSFGTVVNRIEAAAAILFGDDSAVVLGPVTFSGFELPETMPWGGDQVLNVHKMPGGVRYIDSMGHDDMDISWSGLFLSPDASERALTLDEIRLSGAPQALSWGVHLLQVVVSSLKISDIAPGRVAYSITCHVLYDQSHDQGTRRKGLLGSVLDDIGSAIGIDIPATLAAAQSALQTVQQVAQVAAVLTGGSAGSSAVLSATTSASGTLNTAAAAADTTLALPLPAAGDAVGAVAYVTGGTAALQAAATVRAAGAFVGRIAANVQGASA